MVVEKGGREGGRGFGWKGNERKGRVEWVGWWNSR